MVRRIYINNIVLSLYRMLPEIKFPINVKTIINLIPNCKYLSYQEFAELNGCSVDDIIHLCESKSGCTYYDISQDRYLILCNQSTYDNNNFGRQRWTCAHEAGHVLCNHHKLSATITESSFLDITNQDFEVEADYFASVLLAPMPLFKYLNIYSASDIGKTFGLSKEASKYRYEEYLKWNDYHRKTSWENDIIRAYINRLTP